MTELDWEETKDNNLKVLKAKDEDSNTVFIIEVYFGSEEYAWIDMIAYREPDGTPISPISSVTLVDVEKTPIEDLEDRVKYLKENAVKLLTSEVI